MIQKYTLQQQICSFNHSSDTDPTVFFAWDWTEESRNRETRPRPAALLTGTPPKFPGAPASAQSLRELSRTHTRAHIFPAESPRAGAAIRPLSPAASPAPERSAVRVEPRRDGSWDAAGRRKAEGTALPVLRDKLGVTAVSCDCCEQGVRDLHARAGFSAHQRVPREGKFGDCRSLRGERQGGSCGHNKSSSSPGHRTPKFNFGFSIS